MRKLTIEDLKEMFEYTLKQCGLYLLKENDDIIGYKIFEEFDIGVVSFFHIESLIRLRDNGLISDEVMQKSLRLRKMVMKMQDSDKWNIKSVKTEIEWFDIMSLTDEIRDEL